MTRRIIYPAVFETDEDGGYGVNFPDLPGCVTLGDSLEEAYTAAIEALELHLEGMVEAGEALPAPSALEAVEGDPESHVVTKMLIPATAPGRTRRINVTLDANLIAQIDAVASNRSTFLTDAARHELRRLRADRDRGT